MKKSFQSLFSVPGQCVCEEIVNITYKPSSQKQAYCSLHMKTLPHSPVYHIICMWYFSRAQQTQPRIECFHSTALANINISNSINKFYEGLFYCQSHIQGSKVLIGQFIEIYSGGQRSDSGQIKILILLLKGQKMVSNRGVIKSLPTIPVISSISPKLVHRGVPSKYPFESLQSTLVI